MAAATRERAWRRPCASKLEPNTPPETPGVENARHLPVLELVVHVGRGVGVEQVEPVHHEVHRLLAAQLDGLLAPQIQYALSGEVVGAADGDDVAPASGVEDAARRVSPLRVLRVRLDLPDRAPGVHA